MSDPRDVQSTTTYYPPDAVTVSVTPVERTIAGLSRFMTIHQAVSGDGDGRVTGTIHEPRAESIQGIKDYLAAHDRTALLRQNPEPGAPHLIHFGPAAEATAAGSRPWLHIVLFLLTVLSTLLSGALQQNANVFFLNDLVANPASYWEMVRHSLGTGNPLNLAELLKGVPFSFALLVILGGHELGHYFAARRYGVDATLPYFLPMPNPLMGTMGAFIRIRSPIPDRRALVRLGVAGPIAGFLLAVPFVVVGLLRSQVVLAGLPGYNNPLGSSLLFSGLAALLIPNLPAGQMVLLHPFAFAGWLGFFVTALNLIPVGQLDGGHVVYVALGRFRRWFQIAALVVMVALGYFWSGWYFWAVLVLVIGLDHPPTQDEITPLRTSDKLLMLAAVVVFVLTFIPVPFPRVAQ